MIWLFFMVLTKSTCHASLESVTNKVQLEDVNYTYLEGSKY